MTYTYLASPYTHQDPAIMDMRNKLAMAAAARLLKDGVHVYSPIVHCHELASRHDLPRDVGFWWSYNRAMLRHASNMVVLRIDGWDKSRGVAQEIAFAEHGGIPVSFIDG